MDDIRDQIERVLEDVTMRGDHVTIENHGETVTMIVPIEFYKRNLDRSRDEFFDEFRAMAETANLTEAEVKSSRLKPLPTRGRRNDRRVMDSPSR